MIKIENVVQKSYVAFHNIRNGDKIGKSMVLEGLLKFPWPYLLFIDKFSKILTLKNLIYIYLRLSKV